jgi:Nuclease-related domain
MRTEVNDKLVERNRRLAQYLFFFSFAVLIGAFIITNQQAFNPSADVDSTLIILLPSLVLPIGLITTLVSVRMTNLWVREPRPEKALKDGLKGLSNKSVLYSYFHIPARHVLISPQGVYAITNRFQDGVYTVKGDKWSTQGSALSTFTRIFRRDGIGNPNAEAQRAVEHLQKLLQPIAPGVEVKPMIVFSDPRARVTIENPTIPVLYANSDLEPNIKDFMRDVPKEGRMTLTPAQVEAFEQATLPKR